MSFYTWLAIALLVGILIYLATPVVIAPMLPKRLRRKMGAHFYSLSLTALRRGGLVRRMHGGWDLVHSEFDGEKTGEKVTLAGEERFFKDPYNFMTRLLNRPFWIAYEKYNAIVDPRIGEFGEHHQAIVEANENRRQVLEEYPGTDGMEQALVTYFRRDFHLPAATRVVELATWPDIILGGSKPEDAKTTEEWATASQKGFRDTRAWDYVQILTAYVVPVVLMWFVVNYGDTATPEISGPTIGLFIGVVPI